MSHGPPLVSLDTLARYLFRHRVIATLVFFLVLAASVFWLIQQPDTYGSTAKLFVRMGRENLALDPTASTGEILDLFQTQESQINTALEIIKSRHVAELVVDDLGVDTVLTPAAESPFASAIEPFQSAWSCTVGWLGPAEEAPPTPEEAAASQRDTAVRALMKQATFSVPRNSSVIEVSCQGTSPELAQEITRAWARAFVQEHLRVTRTDGSHEFFSGEVDSIEQALKSTEQQLREAKDAMGMVSLEGRQALLESQLNEIRARLLSNKAMLTASLAKIKKHQEQIAALPPTADGDRIAHETWDRMRERLYELQIREQDLKKKLSPSHPDVLAVESQRKEVASILQAHSGTRLQEQAILAEQTQVASYEAEQAVLQEQEQQTMNEILALNEQEARITALVRRMAMLQTHYQMHAEKKEQARIHRSLDAQQISSVNILQDATLEQEPVGPGTTISLLMGLAAALLGSLSTVSAAAYFDRSLKNAAEVEQRLQLPVLGSIPRSSASQSLREFASHE